MTTRRPFSNVALDTTGTGVEPAMSHGIGKSMPAAKIKKFLGTHPQLLRG
jgi:hypothetical protein